MSQNNIVEQVTTLNYLGVEITSTSTEVTRPASIATKVSRCLRKTIWKTDT